jgi:hypothetical protein
MFRLMPMQDSEPRGPGTGIHFKGSANAAAFMLAFHYWHWLKIVVTKHPRQLLSLLIWLCSIAIVVLAIIGKPVLTLAYVSYGLTALLIGVMIKQRNDARFQRMEKHIDEQDMRMGEMRVRVGKLEEHINALCDAIIRDDRLMKEEKLKWRK